MDPRTRSGSVREFQNLPVLVGGFLDRTPIFGQVSMLGTFDTDILRHFAISLNLWQ